MERLFSRQLINKQRLFTLISKKNPQVKAIRICRPILYQLRNGINLRFSAMNVSFLRITQQRRPLNHQRPSSPIISMKIRPTYTTTRFVCPLFTSVRARSNIVTRTIFIFGIKITTQRGMRIIRDQGAVITQCKNFRRRIPFTQGRSISRRYQSRQDPFITQRLLTRSRQRTRQLSELPFNQCEAKRLSAPLIVSSSNFITVLGSSILIFTTRRVLMRKCIQNRRPFPTKQMFHFHLSMRHICLTPQANRKNPIIQHRLAAMIMNRPHVSVATFRTSFPFLFSVIP